jgi:hypothetical protein
MKRTTRRVTCGWCRIAGIAVSAAACLAGLTLAWAGGRPPTPQELEGWPVDVKGHVPVKPGEHPRLLFRKAELEPLRARAKTPEGQAIVKRLRVQLNGSDGESAPDAKKWTMSHVAGFGFLYTLTGDTKYAALGKACMEMAFAGATDLNDDRYRWKGVDGALRAGPILGWAALGYDLCYNGWDEEYRKKVAVAIQDYDQGKWRTLPELTRGDRQHPGSNHWGMQVGGAALALLALKDDPGVDMAKIGPLLEISPKSMIINMTQGFGDGGFFAEGDGTGSMASHIAFLPALQAWRVAAGKEFYRVPRTHAMWMAMRWFFLTSLGGNPMSLRGSFPARGGYPHNIWSRDGVSGGCYFGIGFGVATEEQKAAILWFYNHSGMKAADEKGGLGLDGASCYPHHAILSFVNWPIGMKERNPGEVLPHAFRDTHWKFYAWRNRWQDADDVIISILAQAARGNMGAGAESALTIQTGGKVIKWGAIKGGFADDFAPKPDGSTVLVCNDGSSLAIDFSKASGADALLVQTGSVPGGQTVEAGGKSFSVLVLGKGAAPAPQAQGDKVAVGGQTIAYDGKKIVLGK